MQTTPTAFDSLADAAQAAAFAARDSLPTRRGMTIGTRWNILNDLAYMERAIDRGDENDVRAACVWLARGFSMHDSAVATAFRRVLLDNPR